MTNLKYRKPEEMKDSGIEWIGHIPKRWLLKKLKYTSTIENGATPKTSIPEYWDGDIAWFTPSDFTENTFLNNSARKITARGLYSCATRIVQKNAVLITCRAPIGNLGIIDVDQATFNQGCKALKPHFINHKFLYYSMMAANEFIRSRGKGTTFMELSNVDLKNIQVVSPDAFVQDVIANFLDVKISEFDSIISKKEKLIEKLEEAKKSLISEVVTGKVKIVDGQMVKRNPEEMKDSDIGWLGMVPKEWKVTRIKNISYLNARSLSSNDSQQKEIQYIDIAGISGGIVRQVHSLILKNAPSRAQRIVRANDVIVSTVRTYLKAIALIGVRHDNHICSTGFAVLSPKEDMINPKLLYYMMISDDYVNQIMCRSVGVSYPAINASEIVNLACAYPSSFEIDGGEQGEIVDFLDAKIRKFNSVIEKKKGIIEKIKQAKQSLIYEAVTGKIDLRNWEIIEEGE